MAYTSKQVNTEHPSKTIVKMVSSAKQTGIWPKLLLLCGKEDFLIDWSKGYLKSSIVNPAAEALDYTVFSEDKDEYEIISACETVPLMSERKLVIVDSPDESAGPLTEYLSSIPDTTLLVLCLAKVNKTRSLYKAAAKYGVVYDFTPLDDATLSGWMAKRLKAQGKSASPSDMLSFAHYCGYGDTERSYNLFNLENDLKKVFSACQNSVLSLDDFIESSSPQNETNAFKILDCAFSNRKGEALTILHNTIDNELPSKEIGIVLSFLGLLCSQLEIMLEGKEREEEGQKYYDIIKEMKVNEYRYKKAMGACRQKNAADLRKNLLNAFQIEKDIKSGSMNGSLALELFISNL